MRAPPSEKHRARLCQTLPDSSAANRQCTPQSAPSGASSSPCRGAFLCGCRPGSLPCKGRCRRRRRRGAAPGLANTLPGSRTLPAATHPAKHGGKILPDCRILPAAARPCVGADACIGPSSGLKPTAVYGSPPVFGRNVGRAISPAAGPCGPLRHAGARRVHAAPLPRPFPARPCISSRQCTPQSAPSGASSSPCRGAFRRPQASPARGGVAAGDGGVPHLALQIPFRVAALSRPPHTPQNMGVNPCRAAALSRLPR